MKSAAINFKHILGVQDSRMVTPKQRILVVDDQEVVREGIKSLARKHTNMRIVGEADTSEAAIQLARKLKPHIVLMDFSMPQMNGIEASCQIMAANPDIKILLISSDLDEHIIGSVLLLEFAGLMSKEWVFDELFYAIDIVSRGQRYLCPKTMTRIANFIDLQTPPLPKQQGTIPPLTAPTTTGPGNTTN
jgi:DNA-binding NarL/FixJ family response regulator